MGDVTISLERYEDLLDTETRVCVVVEKIIRQKFIVTEELLRILGTGDAVREANRIKEEEDIQKRKWEKKHGYSEEYDADL